ncbi:MAG: hypothetical protein HYW50_04210 [Candidatus Diapherotrites archaeon]|nr:hypothetical protein [Candidatus Diapherotrites archaeon]
MPRTKLKRILTLLLDHELEIKSKYELAKLAGCTPSWAIMVCKKLEKQGLMKGLKVVNAKKLFELFHAIKPKKRGFKAYSVHGNGLEKIIESFKGLGKEFAFTTYFAENFVQKYLFMHRTDIYVKNEDEGKWHEELTKTGTYGGGNIRIIVSTHDELFNKKQIKFQGKDFWIVSLPQLISDLYTEGGPAGEAADMLLEKLVKAVEAKK